MSDSARRAPPVRAGQAPGLARRFLAPPGLIWGDFTASDGAILRWAHLPARSPRAECVLVTGFMEFIEKQFETMRDLAARGLSIWCFDWRGQGRSTRPRLWPNRPRARRFERDRDDLVEFARAKLTGVPSRFLIAHSMGGATALLCLHANPGLFAGAILSSPMLGLSGGGVPPALLRCVTLPLRLAGLGTCLIPGARRWPIVRTPSAETSRLSSDPERCAVHRAWFIADPELRIDGPTFGWVDAALAMLTRIGRPDFLAAIETPILLGSAEREMLVSADAQRHAARRLPDCTLATMAGSKHELFLERDAIRDDWLDRIDRFISERCGARS